MKKLSGFAIVRVLEDGDEPDRLGGKKLSVCIKVGKKPYEIAAYWAVGRLDITEDEDAATAV